MILQKKSGQSLVEILVAIGVGVIMLVGAITALAPAIKSLTDVSKTQGSTAISKELLDNLRIFAETNWHNIDTLSTSTKYFLNTATSTFVAATGTEAVIADGITAGLVGYWKFDDNTTTSTMDFSGNATSGIVVGNTIATSSCWSGGCYIFDGTGDYVDLGENSITGSSAFTLSAWINTNEINKYSGAVAIGNSAIGEGVYIGTVDTAQVGVSDSIGGGFYGANYGTGVVSINKWTHVAMTFSGGAGGTATIYVDGVSSVSATSTPNLGSTTRRIGRITTDTLFDFSGKVDEVRIYNRALSAAEVDTIYRADIFTRSFQVSDVYRDSADADKIIEGTAGSPDPSTKKITIEYGWPGTQLKTFSAYLTRYKNRSFVQAGWQGGASSTYTSTTANWFTTSSNIDYSTSTGIRIFGL